MDSETYIILIECPVEKIPKYIVTGTNPLYVHTDIKSNTGFKSWQNRISYLNLQRHYSILDKVKLKEKIFWCDHYVCLFKSWGFQLFNDMSKYEIMLEYNRQHLHKILETDKNLDEYHSEFLGKNYEPPKNFNINLLIYFLNDLLNMKVSSRRLDNLVLIYILIFFYGFNLVELSQLNINRLKYLLRSKYSDSKIGICDYKRLECFIFQYSNKYNYNYNRGDITLAEILNIKHPFNSKILNDKLHRLMNFMGYECQITYENHEQIFCLLNLHLSQDKPKSRKYFSDKFGYSEEYLKLMTLNQTYCKVQLPGNIDSKILS